MSLIKRTERLPFIFDDVFNTDWFGNEFVIELAAPGLVKNDFNIELDNETLTISSEKINKIKEEKDNYTRKEFGYSTFKRSFTLPDSVDSGAILASYDQGILSVKLPKKEEAKVQPKRSIEIS